MKKYIVNYQYYSDGGTWFVFAENKNHARAIAEKMYTWEFIKEFVKVYDVEEIKENTEL